jgi:hypothetical protein
MDTTTTHNQGQMPGGVRRRPAASVVCTSWRQHSVASAFGSGNASGGCVLPIHAYLVDTTTMAGAKNVSFIKRPARHLAGGST